MILYGSLREDLVEIRVESSKRSLHALVHVPVRRSCGHPGEKLPCVIVYKTLPEDLDMKSSGCLCMTGTGPCEKI